MKTQKTLLPSFQTEKLRSCCGFDGNSDAEDSKLFLECLSSLSHSLCPFKGNKGELFICVSFKGQRCFGSHVEHLERKDLIQLGLTPEKHPGGF